MKRFRTLLVAVALTSSAALTGLPGTPATASHEGGTPSYFDLAALPAPNYTGKQMFDGLKDLTRDYPARITGTPNEIRAAKFLAEDMAALGYESSIVSLGQNTALNTCSAGPTCVGAGLKAVTALKRGTTRPNEWIMFVGHYDTIPITIDGAYDNGAGTNFIRFLAKEFKDIPTNRSLMFVWYNAEEEGLLASARHAQMLKDSGQQVTAVLGFDMVGIAWPTATPTSTYCLCIFRGANDGARFDPLINYVNFTYLGFPSGSRKVRNMGPNTRNSDESSFASRGFPTMRWAGMTTAGAYNGYHNPNDTIANIIAVAGGEEYYEAGIMNTLSSTYYTTLALDNHLPVPVGTYESGGGRDISFSAASSTDPDGPLTGFRWDFGDGKSATGISAWHTYAAPGIYTVTLTVSDNLFPSVTRSTQFTVNAF